MPPSQILRDRVLRKLDTLSDQRAYQVLDFIEFLESRYAETKASPPGVFQRFAEGVEDTMRAGKVSAATVSEAMSLLGKAMGVLSGVAAAGKSVASDIVGGSSRPASGSAEPAAATAPPPSAPSAAAPSGAPTASGPAAGPGSGKGT